MWLIDSHLDLSWNAVVWNRDLTKSVTDIRKLEEKDLRAPARFLGRSAGKNTVALPEMRSGEIFLCLATLLATVKKRKGGMYLSKDIANAVAQGELAYYRNLESQGFIRMIENGRGLDEHLEKWEDDPNSAPLGFILAMEGADPIIDPSNIDFWWTNGLRVLGITHYDENDYGYGTGFEGGLKPLGFELLDKMDSLGMVLDVTHLSDDCFWDALDAFNGELLASHNNCRALVPGVRQFTNDQINALIDKGGVIGVALDNWMLYEGWVTGETSASAVSLENVVDHIDHICELAGNTDHAAIGSDLDGGFGREQSPHDLDTIADLQKIPEILERRGYNDEEINSIMHGNWLRKFRETLPK